MLQPMTVLTLPFRDSEDEGDNMCSAISDDAFAFNPLRAFFEAVFTILSTNIPFNRHRFTIMASFCPGILYAIIWFLLVYFVGWPIAGFLSCICIFLMPFGACIPPLEDFIELLLKFIKLPLTWAKKGVAMAPLSDCSLD
ncbi:hypothetical protein ACTXT7_005403 [Hymenolepis weldensis]